jgi:hypothetical protein
MAAFLSAHSSAFCLIADFDNFATNNIFEMNFEIFLDLQFDTRHQNKGP